MTAKSDAIRSHLIPQEPPLGFVVLDLVARGKILTAAIVLGDLTGGLRMSPIGSMAADRLVKYSDPEGVTHLVELRSPTKARARIPKVLRAAEQGDAILLLCRTPAVWDVAFLLLNPQPVACLSMSPAP